LLIIDDEWCLISPPKTAGTSARKSFPSHRTRSYSDNGKWWKLYLVNLQPGILSKGLINDMNDQFELVKHAPVSFWQQHTVINDAHKIFCIARNPYCRLVSYYIELKYSFPTFDFSFKDFVFGKSIVDALAGAIGRPELKAMGKQTDFLVDLNGDVRIDRWYKLEEDIDKLKEDFALNGFVHARHHNYLRNYGAWYDDELIDFVRTAHRQDFEMFGYAMHPFWK